jgi:hypothetical protein
LSGHTWEDRMKLWTRLVLARVISRVICVRELASSSKHGNLLSQLNTALPCNTVAP